MAGIGAVALQLVPLPTSLWPARRPERIADGYRLLGIATPALPISLTPYESLDLVRLIPPLAILCAIVRLKAYRAHHGCAALLAGAVGGILLGALQVTSSRSIELALVSLSRRSSFGFAVGFFANANHMATLLVICLPFLAALLAAARRREPATLFGIHRAWPGRRW